MHRSATNFLRAAMLSVIVLTATFGTAAAQGPADGKALTLESYFPKNSWLTGRTPSQTAFAANGKNAAFLDYGELMIYDTASDTTFAAVTETKLREADKDAPKQWAGVRSFAWSARGDELLFTYGGQVYRYTLADKSIKRVTGQPVPEPQPGDMETLRYLPDGSGYIVMHGVDMFVQDIYVGRFNSDRVVAWVPKLPDQGYPVDLQISPDGKQLALLVTKGYAPGNSPEKVNIVNFRDPLMSVKQKERLLPGRPLPEGYAHLYVAPISALTDNGPILSRVFDYRYTGPADWVSRVNWSADSKRLVFAHYEQKKANLRILVADGDGPAGPGDRNDNGRGRGPKAQQAGGKMVVREVYGFTHKGGPSAAVQVQPWFLADNKTVVFTTDQSGWLQLHRLDTEAGTATQLTKGAFEIYPLSLSGDRKALYVAATKEHASRRDVYRVNLTSGELVRLTRGAGSYGDLWYERPEGITNVAISPDGAKLLTTFETFGTLKELVRIDTASGAQKTLTSSHSAQAQKLAATPKVELFNYKNRHGDVIHGYVIKPKDWKATDHRPALIYAYGGQIGVRKMVMDGDVSRDYLFGAYMAEKHGYVSVVIDPRGSSGYGAEFEKANFGKPGKAGVEDLEDGAKYLVANYGVDAKKIAVHGWSFGGFLTQMCMYTSDVFAVGLAGAGPTEWQYYNAWYTSTTIGEDDKLQDYSLVPLAKNLKGQLLLVHGLEDDNVLAQDTMHVLSALLKAGKITQVEVVLDPSGNHGLGGDVRDLDRYQKYEQFLLQRMGSGNGPVGGGEDVRGGRRAALDTHGNPRAAETHWAMKA
jgi:dipeptidyl aminopeptidase/acylaminoacyl peptidase